MKVGLIIPSTSNGRDWKTFNETYLFKHTIKTFLITYDKEHEYTFYIGIDRNDRIYDNDEIKNQIHAYSFVHYQLPLFNDNKITHAEILPEKSNYKIKEIVEETSESITINTIDFNIKLYKCNT